MKHTTTAAAKAEATTTNDFFDRSDIEIPLVYDFAPDNPMRFFMRLQMNKEALEENQKHLGLTPAEREARDHENNVMLLSKLSTRLPEGVPGLAHREGESVTEAVAKFFADGETAMKRKVCVDVLNRYFRLIQPKEYL